MLHHKDYRDIDYEAPIHGVPSSYSDTSAKWSNYTKEGLQRLAVSRLGPTAYGMSTNEIINFLSGDF